MDKYCGAKLPLFYDSPLSIEFCEDSPLSIEFYEDSAQLIKGETGKRGPEGQRGLKGEPGVGVPKGGTRGQVLIKNSDLDYDTRWANQSGGGGGTWEEIEEKPFEQIGEGLKVSSGILMVDTATVVEEDNTKPITSAAVYTEVGNINALLRSI